MIGKTMLFNPFTGAPRHPDDIKSDPQGLLVWDAETPLAAAAPVRPSAAEVEAREALKPGAWLSVRPNWLTGIPEFRVHARPTDGARPVVLLDEAVAYIASLPAAEQSSSEQERREALTRIGQAAVAAGWRAGDLADFVRDRLLPGTASLENAARYEQLKAAYAAANFDPPSLDLEGAVALIFCFKNKCFAVSGDLDKTLDAARADGAGIRARQGGA